jgi:hypothetical protein
VLSEQGKRLPLITDRHYQAAVDQFRTLEALKPASGPAAGAELLVLSVDIAMYERTQGPPARVQYVH